MNHADEPPSRPPITPPRGVASDISPRFGHRGEAREHALRDHPNEVVIVCQDPSEETYFGLPANAVHEARGWVIDVHDGQGWQEFTDHDAAVAFTRVCAAISGARERLVTLTERAINVDVRKHEGALAAAERWAHVLDALYRERDELAPPLILSRNGE